MKILFRILLGLLAAFAALVGIACYEDRSKAKYIDVYSNDEGF